jgi:Ni/Fe-hydrogenase subunit HybB-like protein
MVGSEAFTAFYTGGSHAATARYLFFGLHGHHALVPWTWTAVACGVGSAIALHLPAVAARPRLLDAACVVAFAGIWIEKGMGLIVPGFVPSTLHEIVEYAPTLVEWQVTAGVWAVGFMVFTVAIKAAAPALAAAHEPPALATGQGGAVA